MNNPFAQSSSTYKLHFKTIFQDVEKFSALYEDKAQSIASYEIASTTIDAQADDIWGIEIYLDHQPNVDDLEQQLVEHARRNNLKLLSGITYEKIADLDWVLEYQKNLKPLEIGEFIITSCAQVHLCPPHKQNLIIEASRAFGTGEHTTTSGCLKAIQILREKDFKNIIDIGTGSGILSFAAKKIWPKARVYGCDIEEVALEIAQENAKINNVEINFFQNSAEKIFYSSAQESKFDLIISNILAQPLIDLAAEIKNLAADKAYLILSGFLKNQAAQVRQAYLVNNFEFISQEINNDWVIMMLRINKN